MNAKPFFKSRTIVGAVMMLISLILQYYQIELPAGDIGQAETDLAAALQGVIGFSGFVMVIYGRIKARQKISVRP